MPYQSYDINGIHKWEEIKYVGREKIKAPNGSQTRWDIAIKVKPIKVKF